ncbi:MAG: hypothetical protein AB7D35_11610 [Bacteroidales bacterium]
MNCSRNWAMKCRTIPTYSKAGRKYYKR